MMPKVKLFKADNPENDLWVFFCEGCGYDHAFDKKRWTFNGDFEKPTFSPSLLVYGSGSMPRCHTFVTDGLIQYLHDCEHKLAGHTIELPEYE